MSVVAGGAGPAHPGAGPHRHGPGPGPGARGLGVDAVPSICVVLVAAAVAWLVVVAVGGGGGAMPGTMGLGAGAFVALWTAMVAAMMLPATAPLASLYARSIRAGALGRGRRLLLFLAGYVVVWAAAGLGAWVAAGLTDHAVAGRHGPGVALASAIFATNGAYQLSGLKERCLTRCRMPLGLLLQYLSWRGGLRDVRVGAHHGALCLACCWTLMALLAAFGVMNLWAMAGLAAVVVVEKLAPFGHGFARAVGVASLGLAAAVAWLPWLAPALTHPSM